MSYIAQPLCRQQLRSLANELRTLLQLENTIYFPVLPFLEFVMPSLCDGFSYEITPKSEFPANKHADTDVVNRMIRIREDVYEGAVNGNGRDRMTIVHEISHFLLLVICGVKFDRAFGNTPVITYRDPEWQAKALAGEIMCPAKSIRQLSVEQIVCQCGVSVAAAKYNLKVTKGGDVD